MKNSLVERLNEFSARLTHALEVVKLKYEEAVEGVHRHGRIDLDLVGLEMPSPVLSPKEADAMRLLTMSGLASNPATEVPPIHFPSSSQRALPPASGSPTTSSGGPEPSRKAKRDYIPISELSPPGPRSVSPEKQVR